MPWWRNFLDSLDTPGGHIFLGCWLLVFGVFCVSLPWPIPKAEDLIVAGVTVITLAARGRERANGKPPVPGNSDVAKIP